MSDEGPHAERPSNAWWEKIPDVAPVLLAVHNDQIIAGQLQFVERSYLLPTEVVKQVHELLDQYEVPGSARSILVDQ